MNPAQRTQPPPWYTAAWLAALPLAALYLLWRSRRQPEYRHHWGERFLGRARRGPEPAGAPRIWVHAVSVGETLAAQPLVEKLAIAHPNAAFILTHMTPTGRAAARDLVRAFPGRITQRYLPYDLPFAVRRFLHETRPAVGVLMETEVWPNLLHAAHADGIPVVLANARLSPRSLAKALRLPTLMRRAAAAITVVGAQSEADRARIARIFDGPVQVTGNAKFDREPDAGQDAHGRRLRAQLAAALGTASGTVRDTIAGIAPIWLFASTREGEEKMIVDALRQWHARDGSRPLLLFVPRHPQRFAAVAELLRDYGANVWPRTRWDDPGMLVRDPAAQSVILLGDTMGEMALYYAMADVALIGGSLLPLGGQNLIEACASGCPVVLGPHMFNFEAAAGDAVAAGAARRVADAADALRAMDQIASDPALHGAMVTAARAFAGAHRGATDRTVTLIEQALSSGFPQSSPLQ
jgi:3-deoxy-D-manno-octulosonic-acid transferase